MRIIPTLILLTFLSVEIFAQQTFTFRKGPRFIPGHLHAVITADSNTVRYELFNHWYASSYAELRQLRIPLSELEAFNQTNDTLQIELQKGKVKLRDKRYRLSGKVKHRRLCASPATMRKISFAYNISGTQEDLRHFELYRYEDLQLEEEIFKEKVLENLKARSSKEADQILH